MTISRLSAIIANGSTPRDGKPVWNLSGNTRVATGTVLAQAGVDEIALGLPRAVASRYPIVPLIAAYGWQQRSGERCRQ